VAGEADVRKYFSHQVILGMNFQLFTQNSFLVESFFTTLGPKQRVTGFSADRAMTTSATIDDAMTGAWPTGLLAALRPWLALPNVGHQRLAKVV
jgi:hypothetical protein